jgi:hypothetical protein
MSLLLLRTIPERVSFEHFTKISIYSDNLTTVYTPHRKQTETKTHTHVHPREVKPFCRCESEYSSYLLN